MEMEKKKERKEEKEEKESSRRVNNVHGRAEGRGAGVAARPILFESARGLLFVRRTGVAFTGVGY